MLRLDYKRGDLDLLSAEENLQWAEMGRESKGCCSSHGPKFTPAGQTISRRVFTYIMHTIHNYMPSCTLVLSLLWVAAALSGNSRLPAVLLQAELPALPLRYSKARAFLCIRSHKIHFTCPCQGRNCTPEWGLLSEPRESRHRIIES